MIDYRYSVMIKQETDGDYHAFCPTLRSCYSQGDRYEKTIQNITEAVQLYIESFTIRSESVPSKDVTIHPIHKQILES